MSFVCSTHTFQEGKFTNDLILGKITNKIKAQTHLLIINARAMFLLQSFKQFQESNQNITQENIDTST